MALRAFTYRSRVTRLLGPSVRAVGPMTSFRRVAPQSSPLPLGLSRQTLHVTRSSFSTTNLSNRGSAGMSAQEMEEYYGLNSGNEAAYSQLGRDEFGMTPSEEAGLAEIASAVEDSEGRTKRRHDGYDPVASKKFKPGTSNEYPTTSPLAREILKQTWGFDEFLHKQEEAIARLIHGGSAVVVFPTGGGKSLVFQIPALALDEYDESLGQPKGGITIVVSPLIALIKDQVAALQRRGVKAAAIDHTQSRESVLHTYDLMRKGELKLLYCAPERLNNECFVEMVRHIRVRLIAVDEAHCISEWGQAFRPDYLKVARFVKEMGAERVLCLTATATLKVCEDICAGFEIPESGLFKTTTYRENLQLLAEPFDTIEGKFPRLVGFLRENRGSSIVYVTTQLQAEQVAQALVENEIRALHYHAGMEKQERSYVQDEFMAEKDLTIVATIAFGMGIDKPDIRNVVHYDFPRSLEGYSQEIGRAGRDGLPSKCMLFLCEEDWVQRESFCRSDLPSKMNVNNLLRELFASNEHAEAGDVIEASHYWQMAAHDIKTNTLNLLYSQLELRFEFLRAITPKYSEYRFSKSDKLESFLASDPDPIGKIIWESVTGRRRGRKYVDVDALSESSNVKREEIVHRLQSWSEQGLIDLRPSGVVNRYRMNRPFPKNEADIQELVDKAYEQMEQRELDDLKRSKQVIALITSSNCFALGLAKHFGDEASVGEKGCGKCQFCITGKPLKTTDPVPKKTLVDDGRISAVLNACRVRDDPRLLAKIAFGISSPRIRKEKFSLKNPVFGSMADCDFDELVEAFADHCAPME